jgi:hypothetical protein
MLWAGAPHPPTLSATTGSEGHEGWQLGERAAPPTQVQDREGPSGDGSCAGVLHLVTGASGDRETAEVTAAT